MLPASRLNGYKCNPALRKSLGLGQKKFKAKPLTSEEKKKEAYRRKTANNTWKPPRSEHGLIQEDHAYDSWRVLAICIQLNCTTGDQVKKIILNFFYLCPDAQTCVQVPFDELEKKIKSLGFQHKRSFSQYYLGENWTHVPQLHGVNSYAAVAYAIFCTGRWNDVCLRITC